MAEKDIRQRAMAQIRAYYGDAAVLWPQTGAIGGIGRPDVVACIGGHFVAIEIKAPGKRPRISQIAQLDAVVRAGGIAILYDGSVDIIDMLEQAIARKAVHRMR